MNKPFSTVFSLEQKNAKMQAIDFNTFSKLDHLSLAKHVFPEPFHGSGGSVHEGRMACVKEIYKIMSNNMKLNVQVSFSQWNPSYFGKVVGKKVFDPPVPVIRDNISTKKTCIFYCSDCKKDGNICVPIMKVRFSGDIDNNREEGSVMNCVATVECLYFHNSHLWTYHTTNLLSAGFVSLKIPRDFFAGNHYEKGI